MKKVDMKKIPLKDLTADKIWVTWICPECCTKHAKALCAGPRGITSNVMVGCSYCGTVNRFDVTAQAKLLKPKA